MEELLSLKWNNHRSTFLHILTILRNKQLYTDATLACEGRFYSVHKLVLSTCSDYFSAMFDRTTCKNPIIVLKDIKCEDLEALLDYMYLGEVNVRQADLASLIKAAECLRVKGLAVPDDEPPKKGSHSDSSVRRPDGVNSPPAKRKRRNEDQDGRDDVRPGGGRSSPLSSRPKSPQSHSRLSPLLDSESGRSSPRSEGNQNSIPQMSDDGQQIKVEREDNSGSVLDENYDLANDTFKEEPNTDPGGDLSNDLPEFLQQASGSSYSHSYPGPSFQPDLQNWQGDQVLGGNYSGMGFGPSPSQEGSQNTPASGTGEVVRKGRRKKGPSVDGEDAQAAAEDTTEGGTGGSSSHFKYKIRYRGRSKKKGKMAPMVMIRIPEKKDSLSDYIAVSELKESIADVVRGLNLKLMEELLLMGFPCAICKGNKIFLNLEEHLITNHKMSAKAAEDYVDILMNKINGMISELQDRNQNTQSQESLVTGSPTPVGTRVAHSLTIDNLPLADYILMVKYKKFLHDDFSHMAPVTMRIYARSISDVISFFRQNGLAFSECPIKSPKDILAMVTIFWKFCTSHSNLSPITLKSRLYYFSFFMNNFYKRFYETEATLLKLLNKHIRQIRAKINQEKYKATTEKGESFVTHDSKELRSQGKTDKKLSQSHASKKQGIIARSSSQLAEPSTSGIRKKKSYLVSKKIKPIKKKSVKVIVKRKTDDKMKKVRGKAKIPDSLHSNPIYRKCLSLLSQGQPSSQNACTTRNAVLFTIFRKKHISKRGLCEMNLGDFRKAKWNVGKRSFIVTLSNSALNETLCFTTGIVNHITNWMTRYREFFSSDTSDNAPLFVSESGMRLSMQLLYSINHSFSKLCGFNFSAAKLKASKKAAKKGDSAGSSESSLKQEAGLRRPEETLDHGEESASSYDDLAPFPFPQPKRKKSIDTENNNEFSLT